MRVNESVVQVIECIENMLQARFTLLRLLDVLELPGGE